MSRWHRDNPELYAELGDEGYADMLHAQADAYRDEVERRAYSPEYLNPEGEAANVPDPDSERPSE